MQIKKQYSVALDLSGPFTSFSLLDNENGQRLVTKSLLLSNRNNFTFFELFFDALKELNIEIQDISEWFVGVGPGSFTGLRISSSFVLGITYDKSEIVINAIPSALPVAAKTNPESGDNVAVLYYASRSEILVYCVENKNGVLQNTDSMIIADKKEINHVLSSFNHIIYLSNKYIDEILPESIKSECIILDAFPADLLFQKNYNTHGFSINDLIYIRPPTIYKSTQKNS